MEITCKQCGITFGLEEMDSHAWLHDLIAQGIVPFENKGPDTRGYHMLLPIPPFNYPEGCGNGMDAKLDRDGNIFNSNGKKVGVIVKSFAGNKPF